MLNETTKDRLADAIGRAELGDNGLHKSASGDPPTAEKLSDAEAEAEQRAAFTPIGSQPGNGAERRAERSCEQDLAHAKGAEHQTERSCEKEAGGLPDKITNRKPKDISSQSACRRSALKSRPSSSSKSRSVASIDEMMAVPCAPGSVGYRCRPTSLCLSLEVSLERGLSASLATQVLA